MEYTSEVRNFVINLTTIKIKDRVELEKLKRKFCASFNMKLLRNSELIEIYRELLKSGKITKQPYLEQLFKKRATRTMSGVATVSVITKPFPCPGRCIFCPTEFRVPKSYLSTEPSVMKAIKVEYDGYQQVMVRLQSYYNTGHNNEKIELIVQGGTWSYYPEEYKYNFIKDCYDACNTGLNNKRITSKTLEEAQKLNETAKHRIIGVSLETRPDYIDEKEIHKLREFGCTRIEMGVQNTYDEVLEYNKRLHKIDAVKKATTLLKQAGFKISYHMMPNLPASDLEKDYQMFVELFKDPDFQPDMLKIYPCAVLKNSPLYQLYEEGKFKSYTHDELFNLMMKVKQILPHYVRVNRLIRDIPSTEIKSGNKFTNLRQILQAELKNQNKFCKCIRCREARDKVVNPNDAKLFIHEYKASKGTEFFIQFANKEPNEQHCILFGFLRLRFNDNFKHFIPELQDTAIIRELHTYGKAAAITDSSSEYIQHLGFGKRLMAKAEEIAIENGYKKIAVISGVGVREYYRKLGYKLEGTYMVKNL